MNEQKVTFFGQEMTKAWAMMLEDAQKETHYLDESHSYKRIPYGQEKFRNASDAADKPCRHCKTIAGKLHEPGCNYEECPKCHDSIMNCDDEFSDV